jgi:hypothetical protein
MGNRTACCWRMSSHFPQVPDLLAVGSLLLDARPTPVACVPFA